MWKMRNFVGMKTYNTLNSLVVLALCLLAAVAMQAQDREWRRLVRESPDSYFITPDADRVAANVMMWQRCTGGWPKNHAVHAAIGDSLRVQLVADRERRDDSTIDNDATLLELLFLARYWQAHRDDSIRAAFRRGVQWLLAGQYDNGGWPQFWPQNSGYQVHITYNDNAMVQVMHLVRALRDDAMPYTGLLEGDSLHTRLADAFSRGVQCILNTQIHVNDRPTVWCQQHDHVTLQPAKARAYELPSFCSAESVGLVELLMSLPSPDHRVRAAVHGAMSWIDSHKIEGWQVETHPDSLGRPNRCLVPSPAAPPLWARYYDLDEGRPFVCDRDGIPRRRLEDIGYERRNGYSWYNSIPARLYAPYAEWCARLHEPSVFSTPAR